MSKTVCTLDIVLMQRLVNEYIRERKKIPSIEIAYTFVPIYEEWIVFVSGLQSVNLKVDPSKIGKMHEMRELAKELAEKYLKHFEG